MPEPTICLVHRYRATPDVHRALQTAPCPACFDRDDLILNYPEDLKASMISFYATDEELARPVSIGRFHLRRSSGKVEGDTGDTYAYTWRIVEHWPIPGEHKLEHSPAMAEIL